MFDVLQHSDIDRVLPGVLQTPSSTLRSSLEVEEEDSGLLSEEESTDHILLEDEQVNDFANSVLAAISCWHHRVTLATVRPGLHGPAHPASPPQHCPPRRHQG